MAATTHLESLDFSCPLKLGSSTGDAGALEPPSSLTRRLAVIVQQEDERRMRSPPASKLRN